MPLVVKQCEYTAKQRPFQAVNSGRRSWCQALPLASEACGAATAPGAAPPAKHRSCTPLVSCKAGIGDIGQFFRSGRHRTRCLICPRDCRPPIKWEASFRFGRNNAQNAAEKLIPERDPGCWLVSVGLLMTGRSPLCPRGLHAILGGALDVAYKARKSGKDGAAIERMRELSAPCSRRGYRCNRIFLGRDGHRMSLWRACGGRASGRGSALRSLGYGPGTEPTLVYDFVFDQCANGPISIGPKRCGMWASTPWPVAPPPQGAGDASSR
jgi:hypothetical protein